MQAALIALARDSHSLLAVPSRAPILDQGHCASCYAFAAAGVLTDRISMVDSAYLQLPQRLDLVAWSPQDVVVWCMALHLPRLARMVRKYAIDGGTLVALSEEDLRGLGVTAPFMIQRVLEGLAKLRSTISFPCLLY